jgi:pentatricopeptide repeat protein
VSGLQHLTPSHACASENLLLLACNASWSTLFDAVETGRQFDHAMALIESMRDRGEVSVIGQNPNPKKQFVV